MHTATQPPIQTLSDLDDAALVTQCQATNGGDPKAFEILVRRYEGLIYRVALRYLKIGADADDATQETFLKAFRAMDSFRHDAKFKTWLFKILHNVCMTRLSVRNRRNERELDELEYTPEKLIAEQDDYQQYIDNDAIQHTLAQMNEQERQIIILRHIAELSLQEAANTLGLSLSAAKMRFYRAQERFAAIYTQTHPNGN